MEQLKERSINGSFALIKNNERSLWLQREDNGLLELPGGGSNNNEYHHKMVLIREIEEETKLKIKQSRLRLYAQLGQRLSPDTSQQFGGIEYGSVFLYYSNLYESSFEITLSSDHIKYFFLSHSEIIRDWKKFSSGALWMYFTYLKFQETREIQEGLLRDRRKWKGKEYLYIGK